MKNIVRGNLSFRSSQMRFGTAYTAYRKGERSHWSTVADLYPASDGNSYVVTMHNRPLDARPTLEAAIQLVVNLTTPDYVGKPFEVTR